MNQESISYTYSNPSLNAGDYYWNVLCNKCGYYQPINHYCIANNVNVFFCRHMKNLKLEETNPLKVKCPECNQVWEIDK